MERVTITLANRGGASFQVDRRRPLLDALEAGGYGDHYYKVQIHVPREVAPGATDAVDQLESLYRDSPRASLKAAL